jgi:hypothetical protein
MYTAANAFPDRATPRIYTALKTAIQQVKESYPFDIEAVYFNGLPLGQTFPSTAPC